MAGEWRQVLLEDLAEDVTVGHVGPMASEYLANGVPFLRSQNVEPLRINDRDLKFISKEFHDRLRKSALAPGDVVIVRTGRPGACAVIPQTLPVANCSDLVVVRCSKALNPRFLAYYVNSIGAHHVDSHLVGAVQQHFNVESARKICIRLPSLIEQRAIAHILGTLDDKIEQNRRMSETLEAMAQALFKSWFVDFEPVRAKAEGRWRRGESLPGLPAHLWDLFPDSFEESELGEIPKGWEVKQLSDCVDVTRGLSYKGSGLSDGGIPMHNLNSIYEGGGYKHDGLKRYTGEYRPQQVACAGDLIVANTEQGHHRLLIGYAAIVPCRFESESLFSHHIYRVRPKSDSLLTADYLLHLLNTRVMHDIVSGYANGTTVTMLPIDGLQSPLIVVPTGGAITAFDGIALASRVRHEGLIEESRILAALRDTLLPKLISGELRITEASRILERAT